MDVLAIKPYDIFFNRTQQKYVSEFKEEYRCFSVGDCGI